MGRMLIVGIVVLVMLFGLGAAAFASYGGIGSLNLGTGGPSARSASLHGPAVIGGGPGHGK